MSVGSSRRALNFQRDLTHTITLADGAQVKSLHDARTVLLDVFGNARSGARSIMQSEDRRSRDRRS